MLKPIRQEGDNRRRNMIKPDLVSAVVRYMQDAHPGDKADVPLNAHTQPA